MKPYVESIQTFAAMFDGYDQSLTRLETAVKGKDPAPAFIALFEALNWAVALDDRAGEHMAPEGKPLGFGWRDRVRGAHLMRAVRFARNSVHHQWSDALALDEGGLTFPMTFPAVFFEWRWCALDRLPTRPSIKGEAGKLRQAEEEAEYAEHLEGKTARTTLHELGGAFFFLRQVLEPATIPRRGYKVPPGSDDA
jgi:hypothetical protein